MKNLLRLTTPLLLLIISCKLLLIISSKLLLIISCNTYSIFSNSNNVFVKNNLNRRLKITRTSLSQDKISVSILAGETEKIAEFNKIAPESSLTFEVYGDHIYFTAWPIAIAKKNIEIEFQKLAPSKENSLLVTISQGFKPHLSATYALHTPSIEVLNLKYPRDAFPNLTYYPELKKITEADIIKLDSWKTIVIPKSLLYNETSAEDLYRYILGVPKNYSSRQVKEAYKALVLQWHPDKGTLVDDKDFASRVFNLIQRAYEGLQKAIEDKQS